MRRLPPSYTEQQLLSELGEIPEYNFIRFVKGDASLAPDNYCRAYFNFLNQEDVIVFRDKFDGLEFIGADSKNI